MKNRGVKVPAISPPQANWKQYWLNNRGTWLAWVLSTAALHLLLLSMPFFSTPTVWTLTHVIHNLLVYFIFHHMKGSPFDAGDQGVLRRLTHWEQLDDEQQFTAPKKFVIGITILLFLLASVYTYGDTFYTAVNLLSLALGLLPKFPMLHKFRLFGINKY